MANIICRNPKNFRITEGQAYEILAEDDKKYTIINDNGAEVSYSKNLFEVVVAPEPEPEVEPLTLEELKNAFSVEGTSIIIDLPRFKFTKTINIGRYITTSNINGSNISCGVSEFGSVNSLFNNIRSGQKSSVSTVIKELNELSDDDITHLDFYYFALRATIKRLMLQTQYGVNFNASNAKVALTLKDYGNQQIIMGKQLLISLRHNDFGEDIMKKLKEEFKIHETIVNKNSGNVITTFILSLQQFSK